MSFVSILSVAVGGLFFFLPNELGEAFYPNESTEYAIRVLSLVTPFMYVETVCDGLLKAIGEQMKTLKYQLLNSVLRVILIIFLVSRTGDRGYLVLLAVSNTFSYFLCRRRLYKATGVAPRLLPDVVFPLICAFAGGFSARFVLNLLAIGSKTAAASAGTAVYIGVFSLFMMLFAFERIKNTYKRLRG